MHAVHFLRSRIFLRLAVTSVASLLLTQSPGCSGTVITSHESPNGDGGIELHPSAGGIRGAGGATVKPRGTGGVAGVAGVGVAGTCGDGVIDPGEQCDGANFAGLTCNSATMGAEPNGQLYCAACAIDLSGCYGTIGGRGGSAGMVGFGGKAGVGGFAGFAGFAGAAGFAGSAGTAGMMGVDPAAVCYAGGGVPQPGSPSNCLTGSSATATCTNDYVANRFSSAEPINNSSCASGCGCNGCPSPYDQCATSPDCIYILDCVERTKCARMVDCYQPATCQNVIDSVGGERSRAAIDLSNVLACMSSYGCAMSCL